MRSPWPGIRSAAARSRHSRGESSRQWPPAKALNGLADGTTDAADGASPCPPVPTRASMSTATTRTVVPPPASVEAPSGCGPREIGVFIVVSAALFAGLLWTADAGILLTRHFWLDEYITALIVEDPSVAHAV